LKNEDHGLSVAKNAGAINEANTHTHTVDPSSDDVGSAGAPKALDHGGGNHSIPSEADEHGNAPIHALALESSEWLLPSKSNSKGDSDTNLKNEDHGQSVGKNAGAINEASTHAHTSDASSDSLGNAGAPKVLENGDGSHSISSQAGEHGAAPLDGAQDIEPSSIAHVVFGGPVNIIGLEASFHFKDEISVPKTSGAIKVAELGQPPGAINYDENGLGNHGPVAISEAVQTTELSLPAQNSADPFDIVAHHVGGIVAPHVLHDLIV
jgi:hypothetical protein